MKSQISVIIPTANRPRFLRTALESVLLQTAEHQIQEIIVSENGGNRESERVCDKLADPRIRYEFLSPPLPFPERFVKLYAQAKAEYIATLHDDDWWFPDFLASGLLELERASATHPVYFCNTIETASESTVRMRLSPTLRMWFGAGFPPMTQIWRLSPEQLLLACLSGNPAHYSAGMWRNDVLHKSLHVFAKFENRYDTDRLIEAEASRHGGVIVDPQPRVCIRIHSGADSRRFSLADEFPYLRQTTEYILKLCAERGLHVDEELERLLLACPGDSRNCILQQFHPAILQTLRERNLIRPSLAKQFDVNLRKRMGKHYRDCGYEAALAGHRLKAIWFLGLSFRSDPSVHPLVDVAKTLVRPGAVNGKNESS